MAVKTTLSFTERSEREVALSALADEIRARVRNPRSAFVKQDQAFASARAAIDAARKG